MIINDFNCGKCSGICCINPPELRDIEEINKVLSFGVKILIIKDFESDSVIGAGIEKINGKCPFLNDKGKCDIYENRFGACRDFECKAKKNNKFEFHKFQSLFENDKSEITNKINFKNINLGVLKDKLINNNYEIVTLIEYAKKNIYTDINELFVYLDKIKEKNER